MFNRLLILCYIHFTVLALNMIYLSISCDLFWTKVIWSETFALVSSFDRSTILLINDISHHCLHLFDISQFTLSRIRIAILSVLCE